MEPRIDNFADKENMEDYVDKDSIVKNSLTANNDGRFSKNWEKMVQE